MININIYALIAVVLFVLLFFACVTIAVLLEVNRNKVVGRKGCGKNGREYLCDRRCPWQASR